MKNVLLSITTFIVSFIASTSANLGDKVSQAIEVVKQAPDDLPPSEIVVLIDSLISLFGVIIVNLIWKFLKKKFPQLFEIRRRSR